MRALLLAALLAVPALAALPAPAVGQQRSAEAGSARVVAFINEPREPEFGEVFELEVQVRIAPGVVAFLSDTLAEAASAVSAGPGTWTVAPGAGDSLDVRATYPVMGFLPGGVELPLVELWTRPAGPGEEPGVRPSRELAEAERTAPDVEHALLYLGGIFVMPPAGMVGDGALLGPRPPADVLGGERSAWLLAAVLALVAAMGAAAWLLLSARLRSGSAGVLPLSARARALGELDRIRALGWHTNGRVADFYDATTGVLRHYAERRDPARWRTALTSSELLARLRERRGAEAVEPIAPSVWTAECVKFGTRRPDSDTAEADWSRVRDWIASEGDES